LFHFFNETFSLVFFFLVLFWLVLSDDPAYFKGNDFNWVSGGLLFEEFSRRRTKGRDPLNKLVFRQLGPLSETPPVAMIVLVSDRSNRSILERRLALDFEEGLVDKAAT
jgi:hypothetical protein